MKRITKITAFFILLAAMQLSFSGCSDYFDVVSEDKVTADNNYTKEIDAIAAINGLYGLMQDLVDPLWVVGESRGELTLPARGADKYQFDMAMNQANADNPYTDYAPFYRLINGCNGAIEGLTRLQDINQDYSEDVMKVDVAEVMAIRAWAYYKVAQIWNNAPYFTRFISSIDKIDSIPAVSGDTIIARAAADMAYARSLTTANFANRGQFNYYSMSYFLAEMYLWLGKNIEARDAIISFVPGTPGWELRMEKYYQKYWVDQFSPTRLNTTAQYSWMQYIRFDANRQQKHNILRWTNNRGDGIYAFKPTKVAIEHWNVQPQMSADLYGYYTNDNDYIAIPTGQTGDIWRGNYRSYLIDGKDTLIYKYLINSNLGTDDRKESYKNDMDFCIVRDAHYCLLLAEINNRLGKTQEALRFVNGKAWPGAQPAGYGIRPRVRLMPVMLSAYTTEKVDSVIADERALELAYEGNRWFDLVRMAKTTNNPALLADRIASKYAPSQREAIRTRLLNSQNWYLPKHK
jgi:hypothetical protein